MANGSARTIVLFVEQVANLTPHEAAIKSRLANSRNHIVLQDSSDDLALHKDAALIIVCAKHAPGDLRSLELPVLVCSPTALYDLGMTMAKENADFGMQPYSSVSISSDAPSELVSSGLLGLRPQVTVDKALQGWAKPGETAMVLAVAGSDSSKVVAFAYNQGDAMPGLEAAHRRGAFLLSGDSQGQLTSSGWELFDSLFQGMALGGTWQSTPTPASLWYLKDGSPTRSLTAREYRDWVHEQISGHFWARIRNLGLLSIGAIVAVATIVLSVTGYIKNSIEGEVDGNVQKRLGTIQEQVNSKIDKDISDKLSTQLARMVTGEDSPTWNKIKDQLGDKAAKKISDIIDNDPATKRLLQANVLKVLGDDGVLTEELLKHFHDIAPGTSPKKRSLALQLALVYATPKQSPLLRQILQKIIAEADREDELLVVTALENYEFANKSSIATSELADILRNYDFKRASKTLRDGYLSFISTLSHDHSHTLLDWLRRNADLNSTDSKAILGAIARLKKSARNTDESIVLDYVIDLAIEPDDDAGNTWGIRALTFLTGPDFGLNLTPKAKRTALDRLFVALSNSRDAKPGFIFSGKDHNSAILFGLLESEMDDDYAKFLAAKIGSGKRAESRALQALLFNLVERLKPEGDSKKLPESVSRQLLAVTDVMAGKGTARLAAWCLRGGDPKYASEFLRTIPLMDKASLTADEANDVLLAAIECDARSSPPFDGTRTLWDLLTSNSKVDRELAQTIKEQLQTTLEAYCTSADFDLEDLPNIRSFLDRTDPDRQKDLFVLLTALLPKANKKAIDKCTISGRWDQLLTLYAKLIQQNPKSAELRYERGMIYYDKLHLYADAVEDFSSAISNDNQNSYKFLRARGDAYFKWNLNVDQAVADYQEALKRCAAGDKDDKKTADYIGYQRGIIYKYLSLAYIIKNDKDQANKYVDAAISAFTSPQHKADAEENRCLLLLRLKDWDGVFESSDNAKRHYWSTPWNWICRYIAAKAKNVPDEQAATQAYQEWKKLKVPVDFANLNDYVPDLLRKYLCVTHVIDDRLQGPATLETKFGNSIVKAHSVKMTAGKTYLIDMESAALDAYLLLRKSGGTTLKEDDDSGGGRNARIEFKAKETGEYQIIATSYGGLGQGAYTLIIREVPEE